MEIGENELAKTAAFFVNSTGSHIFLTGKAGTGKTTFLKNLAGRTHKNYVIVAPTGIAALNAGGVTIHSQFQLPLGTFLPDRTPSGNFSSENSIYTQYTLTRKHPISSVRKQVLRSIDLLIIDEVSMLRPDHFELLNEIAMHVKRDQSPFGGIQLILSGDFMQLSPVMERIVKTVEVDSAPRKYCFQSSAWAEAGLSKSQGGTIQLEVVIRQKGDTVRPHKSFWIIVVLWWRWCEEEQNGGKFILFARNKR